MNWQRLMPGPRGVALLSAILLAACASNPATTGAANTNQLEPAPAIAPDDDDAVIEAVPAVAAAPDESAAASLAAPAEPALVCSYERRTGSHRRIKICRRPQSALDEDNTQRTFESLRRSQMQVGEPK